MKIKMQSLKILATNFKLHKITMINIKFIEYRQIS